MSYELEPVVGQWYREIETETPFRVVAIDEDEDLIEIQYADGEDDEVDSEGWFEMDLERAGEPEDWLREQDDEDEEDDEQDDAFRDEDDDEDIERDEALTLDELDGWMSKINQRKTDDKHGDDQDIGPEATEDPMGSDGEEEFDFIAAHFKKTPPT